MACHVHDVGEALHLHEPVDLDRAPGSHAAEVVAAQIHQHDVLGSLLGIGQKLLLEGEVFGRVPAAGPGAGNGRELEAVPGAAHHDLGRGAEEGDAGEAHVEHVGGGVDAAQAPVEREGLAPPGHGEAHRGHGLDGLALGEHGADALHAGLEGGLARLGQDGVEALGLGGMDAGLVGAAHLAVGAYAHLAEAVVDVVQHEHGAGKGQPDFGLLLRHDGSELRREEACRLEADVAVEGAGDGRQVFHALRRLDGNLAHEGLEAFGKGHAVQLLQAGEPVVLDGKAQESVLAGDVEQHVAGQDAVAPPAPVDRRAFKQDAVACARHAHEEADGRVHVCRQKPGLLLQRDGAACCCHRVLLVRAPAGPSGPDAAGKKKRPLSCEKGRRVWNMRYGTAG